MKLRKKLAIVGGLSASHLLTILLTVTIVMAGFAAYNLYFDALPHTATYTIEADGSGNYRAVRYDGSTPYDSTNASYVFNSVISDCPWGGKIVVNNGHYNLSGFGAPIVINKNNIKFLGESANYHRLKSETGATVISRNDGNIIEIRPDPDLTDRKGQMRNIRIAGFKFIGGGGHGITTQYLNGTDGANHPDMTLFLEIDHNRFTYFDDAVGHYAVWLHNWENPSIHHNYFQYGSANNPLMYITDNLFQSGMLRVEHNVFDPFVNDGWAVWIKTTGTYGIAHALFQGNHYQNYDGKTQKGVKVWAYTETISDIHFYREAFERTEIWFEGTESNLAYISDCGVHDSGFRYSPDKSGQVFVNTTWTRSIKIDGNYFWASTSGDPNVKAIRIDNYHETFRSIIEKNTFDGSYNKEIEIAAGSWTPIVRDNVGFLTENWGTATMANATSSVTFSHGLGGSLQLTPDHISFSDSTGEVSYKGGYPSMINATHITISLYSGSLIAGDSTIYWYVRDTNVS